MATNVYAVLRDLASKNPQGPFGGASYYEPLFTGNYPSQNVVIDVYLVERQGSNANTCNSDHSLV